MNVQLLVVTESESVLENVTMNNIVVNKNNSMELHLMSMKLMFAFSIIVQVGISIFICASAVSE